jgi:dipeptidyl-peptidase 4
MATLPFVLGSNPVMPPTLLPRARRLATLAAALLLTSPGTIALAQSTGPAGGASADRPVDRSVVTLDRLFTSPDFRADRLGPVQWSSRSATYTTVEPSPGGKGSDIVRYDAATGARAVLVPATKVVVPGGSAPIDIEDYEFSPDESAVLIFTKSERVWRQNTRGDYWLYDRATSTLKQLGAGSPPSTLMFATFSPEGHRVAYVRQHNLYVEDLATGRVTQLTSDGSPTVINGTFDWVYEEELNLRNGFRWSPDGRSIAYWQIDASGVRDYSLIDDTDSLYSFVTPIQYPKAGDTNSAGRVGVVSADGGPTRWLDVPGDPRNNYITHLQWAPGSMELTLQHLDRHQQSNTLFAAAARTGAVHVILTDRDNAWVDAPADLTWLRGGQQFIWTSERDGWRHAYLVSHDGKTSRLITPGQYEISAPDVNFGQALIQSVDSTHHWMYFDASPDNATQSYLYRARLDGAGHPERVTPPGEQGVHDYQISHDGQWAIHTWSTFDTPPVTELIRLPRHEVVRTLVDNAKLKATLAALKRLPTEFTRLDGGKGIQYDAWLIKPPDFDASKRYPILFFVYGGPAAQTVLDQWTGFQYLFQLSLAQQGYIVASVDNRGTPAARGAAWRKAIYKKMGVIDVQDQIDAARALMRRPYADATRVGVYGHSGGGTMTLNLLFQAPDLYQMGIAMSPVSDQRLYDTIYTERYMGLPQDDPNVYRQASPMSYVDGFKGHLLLVHGSGDDNVHYQNSEVVVNALVAADKPFDLMVYPNRTHCICEGQNTTRHLYELLTRYTHEHLPAGPRGDVTAQ